jgi:putative ABC transport system permease protein
MPMSIAGGPEIPVAALVGPSPADMTYVLRTTPLDPFSLLSQARAAIDAVDPKLAMSQVLTLEERVDTASAQMAFTMVLLAIAAAVALLLGIVGVYGVTSYIVTQRTGEIGVRLALGERPGTIAAAIVRQGGMVTVAGIIVGVAATLAGGRYIESLLFGVTAHDRGVIAAATTILLAVALLACWLPARRASRLSPLEALRPEG